jgi:hypothetical protein
MKKQKKMGRRPMAPENRMEAGSIVLPRPWWALIRRAADTTSPPEKLTVKLREILKAGMVAQGMLTPEGAVRGRPLGATPRKVRRKTAPEAVGANIEPPPEAKPQHTQSSPEPNAAAGSPAQPSKDTVTANELDDEGYIKSSI